MNRFGVLGCPAILSLACALVCSLGQAKSEDSIEIDSRAQLFVDEVLVDRMERVWLSSGGAYNTRPKKVAEKPDNEAGSSPGRDTSSCSREALSTTRRSSYSRCGTNTLPPSRSLRYRAVHLLCGFQGWSPLGKARTKTWLSFRVRRRITSCFAGQIGPTPSSTTENDPDPNRRFKMVYWQTENRDRCGIWSTFSPDGIRWTDIPNNPVVPCWASGDTFSVTRDPVSKQYWLYHKTSPGGPRKVSRLVSDDFVHWRDDRLVLEPDKNDPPGTEFYGLSAFPYGSQYLGLVWVFHTAQQTMYAQLVSSRDGVKWERSIYRRPFIVLGYMVNHYVGKSFDSGMVFPVSEPVVKDGEVWIYYSGFDNLHNAEKNIPGKSA